MANRRFNTQVAQPRKALAKGGMSTKSDNKRDIRKTESMIGASKSSKREKGKYPSKGMNKLASKRPDVAKKIMGYKEGGRMKKMGGGMSTARKDMMAGYYTPDMGMKGGAMYKEGGKVKKKKSRKNPMKDDRSREGLKSQYRKMGMGKMIDSGEIDFSNYRAGGRVGKKQQGYKDRKDESIAMRIRKPRTARQLKDSRDESYGKFGSKAKKSGKINR